MTAGRTFKFWEYMHNNMGNKNMHNNYLHIAWLGVKDQINKPLGVFCTAKAFEPLMLET